MSETIRVCTWNIQLGLQLDRVMEQIARQGDFKDLDLLALQEASVHSNTEDARRIAELLGPSYDCYQVTAHRLGGLVQANALVWNMNRFELLAKDSVRLPHAREVQVSLRERAFLRALPSQERNTLVVQGVIAGRSLRIYAAHLDVIGFQHKREQFNHILKAERTLSPVELTILAGDLNTFKVRSRPTWSGILKAAQAEGFEDLTGEILWTHSVRKLRLKQKLDAIFVKYSGRYQYRAWSLDIPGSDHIPVFANISVGQQNGN